MAWVSASLTMVAGKRLNDGARLEGMDLRVWLGPILEHLAGTRYGRRLAILPEWPQRMLATEVR